MAQHGPGHVQAELPTEAGRRVVPELVRVPIRDRPLPGFLGRVLGLANAVGNRVIEGPRIVSLSWFPLWTGLAPILLRRLDLAFPVPSPLRETMLHRLPWREQVGRQLHPEPRPENLLGRRAEIDSTLPAVMLRLVSLRREDPDSPTVGEGREAGSHQRKHRGPASPASTPEHRPGPGGDQKPRSIRDGGTEGQFPPRRPT